MSPLAWPLPSAHARQTTTRRPPIPHASGTPADTQCITDYQQHGQCNCVPGHGRPASSPLAAAAASSRHQGPRGRPTLPKCLSRVGQGECASLANSPLIWMLLWGAYWRPTVFPNTGGGCYHFPSTGGEAHHRFQLITDFSLHDLLRGKSPRRKEANCPLSRTYLSSAVASTTPGPGEGCPQDSWLLTPSAPVAVESWMWTTSCSSSLYKDLGSPWWLRV